MTSDKSKIVSDVAKRHDLSEDAVGALLEALTSGHGQAQFNHPELGGMGQWSGKGNVMIGEMSNSGLKAKVDAACSDLADRLSDGSLSDKADEGETKDSGWPAELGTPSATGSQNAMRYAVFPETHRLAVERDGKVEVYDTGAHRIGGASQQQSSGQSLSFSSQNGPVALSDLKKLS